MNEIPLWSLTPALVALAANLSLLFVGWRMKWSDTPVAPLSSSAGTSSPAESLERRRWIILLIAVGLALAFYLLIFAPPALNKNIPPEPNTPGSPFYFLHWQRNFLRLFYPQIALTSNLLTGALAFLATIYSGLRRSPEKLQASLLWTILAIMSAAQWLLFREDQYRQGLSVYWLATLALLIWAAAARKRIHTDLITPFSLPLKTEIVLLLLTIGGAAFGRFYALKTIPYGIEGDEAKWTAEVVSLHLRGEADETALYHRDALPVSFYMQTPFHKIFGPSILSARLEVAFFSTLATLLFYLLLRRLGNIPIAWLATWLLSGSIFDISASRLANVESHVKIWPILTLLLLEWALRHNRWQAYAISGMALALSMVTYDTLWPLLPLTLIIAAIELQRQKIPLLEHARHLTALLAPTLLALPILLPYFASRLSYYGVPEKGWEEGLFTLLDYFGEVLRTWYVQAASDFLYNRPGPLLNAFLLPWLTLGFIAAFFALRQRIAFWTLAWVLLFIFPTPILAHSPLGRVYYPALPAIYALIALAGFIFSQETLRLSGKIFHPLLGALALLIVIWLPLFNLYIYFNEVSDFTDRQIRREIGEMAAQAASPETLLLLPTLPAADEPLNNEHQMIELFMLSKIPPEQVKESYRYVALEDLLPSLPIDPSGDRPNIVIFLDKTTSASRQQRDDLAAALKKCYPSSQWYPGKYLDRVYLSQETLSHPACIATRLTLTQTTANTLTWSLSRGHTRQITLNCQSQRQNHQWLEAENLPLAPGWQINTAFATDWNGKGYIMDNSGSQPIRYEFNAPQQGQMYVWLRTYKRTADNSPAHIEINGKDQSFGDYSGERLNRWVWERSGPFPVRAGSNTLVLSRPYLNNPQNFMAIFIDTLIFTFDENFDPQSNLYIPLPPQTFRYQPEQSQGEIELTLAAGQYLCSAQAEGALPLVDSFGHSPLTSEAIFLTIQP